MRWRRSSAFCFACAAAALSFVATSARADDKQACLAASEKGQQLKNAGKLTEARDQLAVCARAQCPKLIREDCTQWMADVLSSLPSIVPAAKDAKGADLTAASVAIDGKVVAETLEGKAFAIDPGVHVLRFETKGAPPHEERIVVKQGEKNRIVTATFAVADEPPRPGPIETNKKPDDDRSPPVAAFVVGGLGLAAGAVALAIDLSATSDAHDLRDTCAPRCNPKDVDDVQGRYTIAAVTAGVGGVLLVAGVVLFVLHGSGRERTGRAPTFLPRVDGRGAAAIVRF